MSLEIEFDIETQEILKQLNEMSKNSPKLVKKYLKNVGKNMTKTIKKSAKILVKPGKKQKNPNKKYHNRFKTSKILEDTGSFAVGTYNSTPHAHLIEYGHKKVDKNGKVHGFVEGKFPIKKGVNEYNKKASKDIEEMLEKVINEGGL